MLKRIKGIRDFIDVNDIDDRYLTVVARYIRYLKVPKGTLIFKQFDVCTSFFVMLRGEVSVRVNNSTKIQEVVKMANKKGSKSFKKSDIIALRAVFNKEEAFVGQEVLRLKHGTYFGDNGLIDGLERTCSTIAEEDCDLLEISKFGFEKAFRKPLYKTELLRKSFILNSFQQLRALPEFRFENFFKNLIPVVIN